MNSLNSSIIFSYKARINLQNNSSLSFSGLNVTFYDNYWNTSTIINYKNETVLNFFVYIYINSYK